MKPATLLLFAACACALPACRHKVTIDDDHAATTPAAAPLPVAAPAPAVTNITIQHATAATSKTITLSSTAHTAISLAPTAAPGTIEMSGFSPFKEDVTKIRRVRADSIDTDPTGKMTLRGNALVEVQQGQAISRLRGDLITVQGGPGFNPQIEHHTASN
jgi:hypothetical protein